MRLLPSADLVLDEQRHGTLVDDASSLTERDVEGICRSGQERIDARKVEHAGALGEVLVDEMPVLAAKCHRMAAARVAECVDQDIGRIRSALGEGAGPAEVEIARHDHLRQADRARDAIPDAEVRRIERRRWKRAADQPAPSKSHLVHGGRSERVRVADRQGAPERV